MKKVRNPLLRRLPRELMGDWRKYLVAFLFLVLTIGFVSGMYVANDSMLQAARTGKADYKLESGHFELTQRASEELLQAIRTGEKADVTLGINAFSALICGTSDWGDALQWMPDVTLHRENQALEGVFYRKKLWIGDYF